MSDSTPSQSASTSTATRAGPVVYEKTEEELRAKTQSSVRDQRLDELNSIHRADWGTRVLTDESKMFTLNAWDHAEPPKDIDEQVAKVKQIQREKPVSDQMKEIYNKSPASFWERFYDTHKESFFKDRKWLRLEFPELMALTAKDAGARTIIEIGCGAGNALYPIYEANKNPDLTIHGFDYSKSAVDVVKENPLYTADHVGKVNAAVWDLSSPEIPDCIQPGTVDIAVMVFVLSALRPGDEWERAMGNVFKMLKPGGMVLLRDYGRHDLAQMRIKGNRMLDEDFYIRGDGTRVFFFDSDDLARIFTGSPAPFPVEITTSAAPATDADTDGTTTPATPGEDEPTTAPTAQATATTTTTSTPDLIAQTLDSLTVEEDDTPSTPSTPAEPVQNSRFHPSTMDLPRTTPPTEPSSYFPKEPSVWHPAHPLFKLEQLGVDRRLLINRKKQLKMYRVWMQVKVRKIGNETDERTTAQKENKREA